MKNIINIIKDILLITCIILLAIAYYRATKYRYVEPLIIELHDTIETERIIEKTKTLYKTVYDTIIITDTAANGVRDTVKIEIPIEHKDYRDTISTDTTSLILDIKYSGFRSTIDGLEYKYTYQPTKPSQNQKKAGFGQFVGIGAYAGTGFGYGLSSRQMDFTPSVGVCLVYGIGWTW